jgi:hypothetical protein
MAKAGTKYSDVNFSIPEGADPLGVGIPDLGRSSYDPVQMIMEQSEQRRVSRQFNRQMQAEEYQNYLKNMPTVEGTKSEISKNLNSQIQRMGELFIDKQKAGDFFSLQKSPTGGSAEAELNKLQNKIATDVPIYNHYSDQMAKDVAATRVGANKDKIDWELTKENMKAAEEGAKTGEVQNFAQPFADNGGSLVVWRPEEADMLAFIKDSVDTLAPGMDSSIISEQLDPETGKMRVETLDYKSRKRMHDAIVKGYDNAPRAVQNEVKRMYDVAPQAEKVDGEGVPLEPQVWYANKYVPVYGQEKDVSYVATDKKGKQDWMKMMGIGRDANGALVLGAPTTKQIDRQREGEPVNTGTNKKPVWETPMEETSEQYYAYTADLSGVIDKPFALETSIDTYDQQSGEKIPAGIVAYDQPTSVSLMPTAGQDITFKDAEGNTRTIKKGDLIKIPDYNQLPDKSKVYWDWFVTSASSIKKTPAGGVEAAKRARYGEEYDPTHQITTIRPWSDAKNAIIAETAADYDLTELDKLLQEMKKQKNSGIDAIIQQVNAQKAADIAGGM